MVQPFHKTETSGKWNTRKKVELKNESSPPNWRVWHFFDSCYSHFWITQFCDREKCVYSKIQHVWGFFFSISMHDHYFNPNFETFMYFKIVYFLPIKECLPDAEKLQSVLTIRFLQCQSKDFFNWREISFLEMFNSKYYKIDFA